MDLIKKGFFKIIRLLFLPFKLYMLNKLITEGNGKIVTNDLFLKIKIFKGKNSKFILNGNLTLDRHLGGESLIYINIGDEAELKIDGNFMIGNGVRIHLCKKSQLKIGGAMNENISGITENTKIMVYDSVTIGKDFICAWDVFITDSDWHKIEKDNIVKSHHKPVYIGDHVWVTSGCKILKGTNIGKGSIVAGNAILTNNFYPDYSIIAGNPPSVVSKNINWSREI